MSDVSAGEALGYDRTRIVDGAELIEKVEALPWTRTWAESTSIARLAHCAVEHLPRANRPGAIFPRTDEGIPIGWLWVQFKSGDKAYVYADVPFYVYVALIEAESPGKAHRALVKGHYRFAAADLQTGRTWVEA